MADDDREIDTMLTTTDVAGKLGYSDDAVRRMCEQGRFDGDPANGVPGAYRAGLGSHWRIPLAAVEAFVARSRPRIVRRSPGSR
jgi:hypothetical protein